MEGCFLFIGVLFFIKLQFYRGITKKKEFKQGIKIKFVIRSFFGITNSYDFYYQKWKVRHFLCFLGIICLKLVSYFLL